MRQSITVHVIDDDPSVRRSLGRLFRSHGYSCHSHANAEDYLGAESGAGPSCLVLDMRLEGQTGFDVHDQLRRVKREIPTVFITGHGDIAMGVRAMKCGAVDFLTKPVDERDLIAAVELAIERDVERTESARKESAINGRIQTLSPREREVMAYLLTGALNKQIAGHLNIVEKTVKVHRARVLKKMGVLSIAELVRCCTTVGVEPARVE